MDFVIEQSRKKIPKYIAAFLEQRKSQNFKPKVRSYNKKSITHIYFFKSELNCDIYMCLCIKLANYQHPTS